MPDIETTQTIEFRPRASNGRIWVGAIGLISLALFIIPLLFALAEMPLLLFLFFVLIGFAISGPILLVAWKIPDMRYELGPDKLMLRFPPFVKDEIPVDAIRSVRIKDRLKISLIASFRFPGLAIMDVLYRDEGQVRMCATSASKRILLITTNRKTYGITPDDEEAFLYELAKRVDDPDVLETDVRERVLAAPPPAKR